MTDIVWQAFIPASLLMSLIPGANQILSIQHGAKYGIISAAKGLLGRFSAFFILACCAAFGLSSILINSPTAFLVVRLAGAAYLAWLAVSSLQGLKASASQSLESASESPHIFRRETLTALTNPKAILLFAVFVPQFVDAPTIQSILLAGCSYIAIEASTAMLYILLGKHIASRLTDPRRSRFLAFFSASAYLAMGAWILLGSG